MYDKKRDAIINRDVVINEISLKIKKTIYILQNLKNKKTTLTNKNHKKMCK